MAKIIIRKTVLVIVAVIVLTILLCFGDAIAADYDIYNNRGQRQGSLVGRDSRAESFQKWYDLGYGRSTPSRFDGAIAQQASFNQQAALVVLQQQMQANQYQQQQQQLYMQQVEAAKWEVIAKHPDATDRATPFGSSWLSIYDEQLASNSTVFQQSNWPLIIMQLAEQKMEADRHALGEKIKAVVRTDEAHKITNAVITAIKVIDKCMEFKCPSPKGLSGNDALLATNYYDTVMKSTKEIEKFINDIVNQSPDLVGVKAVTLAALNSCYDTAIIRRDYFYKASKSNIFVRLIEERKYGDVNKKYDDMAKTTILLQSRLKATIKRYVAENPAQFSSELISSVENL